MLQNFKAQFSALLLATFAALPAQAAVTTTGCALATTCSLAELYDGGTIKVGDVTFGGFAADPPQLGLAVAPAGVLLTGVEGANSAALDFGFSPGLAATFDDFLGYFFDYSASIDGASSQRFNLATLSFVQNQLSIRGEAQSQVDMGLSATDILSVYADFAFGTQATDSLAFANLTTLAVAGAITLNTFAADSGAAIQGFRFALGLSGEPNVVPLPAAAPLFLAGLAAFGAMRRRKTLAKVAASA